MSLINGEILLGITDGVNVVYSTQHTIDTVEEIRVGGTPLMPSEYTVDGNRIILDVAIEGDNPIINYFSLENKSAENPASVLTVGDILDEVKDIIGISAFDTKAYKESVAIKRIESLLEEVEVEEEYEDKIGQLTFTKGFDPTVGKFTRNDLINTTPMGNFLPRFGKIYLDGEIIDFSTRTDSAITLEEPITFEQKENSQIAFGYKLPSAVQDIRQIKVGGFYLTKREFDKWTPLDLNTYTIKEGYLFIGLRDKVNLSIVYTKPQQDRSAVTDELKFIPKSFCDVFALYASFNMMRNREDDRWEATEVAYKKRRRKFDSYIFKYIKGGLKAPTFTGPLNRIK